MTTAPSSGACRPVSNGQMRTSSAQRGSSRNARTTGMPVSAWPPTEPAPSNFQQGWALGICKSTSRRSANPPFSCARWCLGPRKGVSNPGGRPQKGKQPFDTRRLNSAAISKRLFPFSSESWRTAGDLVPDGTPRRPGEAEPRGKACGITKREVEADQDPLPRSTAAASQSASMVFAACRVGGLSSLSPSLACQQIQMLSRPVRGTVGRAPIDHHEGIEHHPW